MAPCLPVNDLVTMLPRRRLSTAPGHAGDLQVTAGMLQAVTMVHLGLPHESLLHTGGGRLRRFS